MFPYVSLFFLCHRVRPYGHFPFLHDPRSTSSFAFSAHHLYDVSLMVANYPKVRVSQIQVSNSLNFIEPRRENGPFQRLPFFSAQHHFSRTMPWLTTLAWLMDQTLERPKERYFQALRASDTSHNIYSTLIENIELSRAYGELYVVGLVCNFLKGQVTQELAHSVNIIRSSIR
jgi:hypothetical protein